MSDTRASRWSAVGRAGRTTTLVLDAGGLLMEVADHTPELFEPHLPGRFFRLLGAGNQCRTVINVPGCVLSPLYVAVMG